MADIVPFGKYKNQPVEVLAKDEGYCEWLVGQGWVAERYPALHTLIINHCGEPTETPEHNALQLRFLDGGLCRKVAMCAVLFKSHWAEWFGASGLPPMFKACTPAVFERQGIDVQWQTEIWVPSATWEHSSVFTKWTTLTTPTLVECKPSLGDDYPAVLRTAHATHCNVVVSERCSFLGGTLDQVRQLFLASGVLLLQIHELKELPDVLCVDEKDLPPLHSYTNELPHA
jgi:hypothetical protein